MLEGFKKIHYLAYSIFFLGKLMFVVSVGALYSDDPNCLYYGAGYVALILISLFIGLYDQKRTVGFGIDELRMEWPLAPIKRHKYE